MVDEINPVFQVFTFGPHTYARNNPRKNKMKSNAIPGTLFVQALLIFYICMIDFPSRFSVFGLRASAVLTLMIATALVLMCSNLMIFHSIQISSFSIVSKLKPGRLIASYLVLMVFTFGILGSNFNINTQQNLACYVIIFTSYFLGKRMQTGLNLHAVLKRVQIAISFSSMLYIATCVKYGAGNDFIYFPRAIAMISCLGIGITFYLTEQKRITKFLYQSVFLGSVLLSLSRTAIFVVGVTFFSLTVWRSKKQLLATLMSLTTLFTFAYFIFLLPVIRNRFNFIGDQATFGGRTINTAGRTKIWGVILQESSDSIFLGHGIGSSEDLVLSNFQTISQPHNDFLRIFFDFGILGFIVLCLMLLLLGLDGKTRRNSTSANALMFKIKNVLALQLFSFMLTDNPIVYPFYTLPLFFILGVSSGQSNSQRSLE